MQQRTIGPFTVSAIGLGAMPVSMNNDRELPSRGDAIATVHAALDAGVTFIDTADIYAPSWDEMGHNERIVRDALASWNGDADGILVGTKGGITRTAEKDFGRDGSLAYLRSAVLRSQENLGVDVIDLYQLHWPKRGTYGFRGNWTFDPSTSSKARVEDHMNGISEAMARIVAAGKVREFGLSNETAWGTMSWLAAAERTGGPRMVSVQNEYGPLHRLYDTDMAEVAANEKVTLLAYSPLAAGLLTAADEDVAGRVAGAGG